VERCSPLDRYLHLHLRVNLEGLLLRLDANTMAASVEGRVPFTDRAVVEWANTLPDPYRLRRADRTTIVPWRDNVAADWMQRGWLSGKWVLREAFRSRLPAVVVDRPKLSFPVPFESVLAARSADDRAWALESPELDGLLDRAALASLWEDTEDPGQIFRRWPVVNLLKWAQKWKIQA
ncbi:MAG: asparagine synthase-related protein, partial [Opitutales bacterium]